jgi:hypothetical protein
MASVRIMCGMAFLVGVAGLGCQRQGRSTPPPDAHRPQIKTEAELTAEREERIRAGQIVPTSVPVVPGSDRLAPVRRPAPSVVRPMPGAIEGDVLLVDDAVLTVAEVLYPLRDELAELRQQQTPAGFRERAAQAIRRQTQQQLGSVLVYAKATAKLDESAKKALDERVRREVEDFTARDFGGSAARLSVHLAAHGLTVEQLRANISRSIAVREYTREKLMPQVQIRRDELLSHYRRNIARYSTPETRELLVIELPFERFLPEGQTWDGGSATDRAQAKMKAVRRAREAHAALGSRPFEDVAREHSLGLHADRGGSWGMIGRPLQPPYDEVSRTIFQYEAEQYSAPLEMATGWCIVKCGRIEPARQRALAEVQDEIRQELMESRFSRLSMDYVLRLAEKATVSALDPFVAAALKRAEQAPAATASTR